LKSATAVFQTWPFAKCKWLEIFISKQQTAGKPICSTAAGYIFVI
jgi:hypothetical protein